MSTRFRHCQLLQKCDGLGIGIRIGIKVRGKKYENIDVSYSTV